MKPEALPRKIISTEDGSQTIFIPGLDEHYHSVHGAIQESMHVYINAGLNALQNQKKIKVFEVGFGTGLNALLTYNEAVKQRLDVFYTAIEKYPLSKVEYSGLSYSDALGKQSGNVFNLLHDAPWDRWQKTDVHFQFKKIAVDLLDYNSETDYNLIYFDAFNPNIQPHLWTFEVFEKMYQMLAPQGILVTYSAKGEVRRSMVKAGFTVERIPGPPGKREMMRGIKV